MEPPLKQTAPEIATGTIHQRSNRSWLWLWLLFVGSFAQAEVPKPKLHWCLDHFPRFHEFHGRNKPTGPSVAVMEELAKRAGFTIEYSARTPLARCIRQIEQGETDLMINLNYTPEREAIMHLFPYNETIPETLYLRGDDPRFIDQLSQLTPLILVTVRNYSYNPTLMALMKDQTQHHLEVDSIAAGFELLLKGRVDGLIVPTQSSLEVIRNQPKLHHQFRKADLTFRFANKRYINIGLSKKSKHLYLKEKIEKTVAQMMTDGTVQRLYGVHQQQPEQSYLLKEPTKRHLDN
ncbi:MAG: transporter substrate-binding domain-containing protein [Gammaproteobacteria bacterium]|nr:transporter substrate-binding domain-containing protein [Gammaproteobacteria bacterium]MBU2279733.1 transporter substrate-binding domain-containing protein [Gammaproteobacteria bacterium]